VKRAYPLFGIGFRRIGRHGESQGYEASVAAFALFAELI
jgi:hypothetical protein